MYLFSVVCDRLHDGAEGVKADSHVQQVGSEEEVVEIAQARPGEIPGNVQERLENKYNITV